MKFLYIIGAVFIIIMIISVVFAVYKNNNNFIIIFIISALLTYYDLSKIIEIKQQTLQYRHLEALKEQNIKHTKEIYDMVYSRLMLQKDIEKYVRNYEKE